MNRSIPVAAVAPSSETSNPRPRRWIWRWLPAALLSAIVWVLISRSTDIEWREVLQATQAYEWPRLLLAGVLAFAGHLAVASYDPIASRLRATSLSLRVMALISFVSYVLAINVGTMLGGWASRARLYARRGVPAPHIALIVATAVVTNWSGFLLLSGVLLCVSAPLLPAVIPLGALPQRALGVLLLLVVLVYGLAGARAGRFTSRPLLHKLRAYLPSPSIVALQLLVSSANWSLMALSLYLLMPADLAFVEVLAALLIASIAGALLHVPGNLGVLEASLATLLGSQASPAAVLAAALTFRLLHYLVPLPFALAGFVAMEWRRRRRVLLR